MGHTLGTAAKATGLSRTAILRAIKSSKISAKKNEHGEWDIDPAELHRVYPPVSEFPVTVNRKGNDTQQDLSAQDNRVLQVELEAARQRLRDKDDVIQDLRRRLDQSEEERREKDRRLTALLTDQRTKAEPPGSSEAIPLPPPAAAEGAPATGAKPEPASTPTTKGGGLLGWFRKKG